MKHYTGGKGYSGNLNEDAYNLLERAINNYMGLDIEHVIDFWMKMQTTQEVFEVRNNEE